MNKPIPQNAIHQAAADGNVDLIKEYLTKDPTLVSQLHSTQCTIPLIHAIRENRVEAVECLLEAGSPLDFVDKTNDKLLMHFIINDSDEGKRIRNLLSQYMYDKFKKLKWGLEKPFDKAAHSSFIIILNLILYSHEASISLLRKKSAFEELKIQLDNLYHYTSTSPRSVHGYYYNFVGDICAQTQSSQKALFYYQYAIRFYLRAIELAQTNDEKVNYFKIVASIYSKLAEIMQSHKSLLHVFLLSLSILNFMKNLINY